MPGWGSATTCTGRPRLSPTSFRYYRNTLKQRGELVYEQPALHQFDIGRFREESMAFPPSVTVKDYTFGGTGGYLNPKRGATPARFATIIQIVPNPPGGDR